MMRLTMDVRARKVVVDTMGAVREVPMHDLVAIGAFTDGPDGERGAPVYRRLHRIRSGAQRVTLTVPPTATPVSSATYRANRIQRVDDDVVRRIANNSAQAPSPNPPPCAADRRPRHLKCERVSECGAPPDRWAERGRPLERDAEQARVVSLRQREEAQAPTHC